jgi:hypothetical protein
MSRCPAFSGSLPFNTTYAFGRSPMPLTLIISFISVRDRDEAFFIDLANVACVQESVQAKGVSGRFLVV